MGNPNIYIYIVEVREPATEDRCWRRSSKNYCAIVTQDVRNAINPANQNCILEALRWIEILEYIRYMIGSYFRDRALVYDNEDGPKTYIIMGGVPQN